VQNSPAQENIRQGGGPAKRIKDPLNVEPTAYDILEIGPAADTAEIRAAFNRGLVKKVNIQKLTSAQRILKSPPERALLDLFYYNTESMSRLTPNPVLDPSVLLLPNRALTAEAWGKQLRTDFPDLGIVHCLAVLWYWWAVSTEEQTAAGLGAKSTTHNSVHSVDHMWQRAIACWAMLVSSQYVEDGFASVPADVASQVQKGLVDRLSNRFHDLEQKCGRNGLPTVGSYQGLDLGLAAELRTGRHMAGAGIRTSKGKICCGVLMLEQVGLLTTIRNQVREALQKNPFNETLQSLLPLLSPFAKIGELIDRNMPQAAIEAIDALPPDQSKSKEVLQLRSRALYDRGKQHVSLGEFDAALANWSEALRLRPEEKLNTNIREEIVATCQTRASALQQHQVDKAIAFLDAGLSVVEDARLKLVLAELLTSRGIECINKAQKRAKPNVSEDLLRQAHAAAEREEWGSAIAHLKNALHEVAKGAGAEFKTAMKQGLNDLERAVKLGSKRAVDQVQTARELYQQDSATNIKKNLAVCLGNRSGQIGGRALESLKSGEITPEEAIRRLELARNDLKEASVLDPSDDVRNRLSQLDDVLTILRNPAAPSLNYSSPRYEYRTTEEIGFVSAVKAFFSLGHNPGSMYPYPAVWWLVISVLAWIIGETPTYRWLGGISTVIVVIFFLGYWGVQSARNRRY